MKRILRFTVVCTVLLFASVGVLAQLRSFPGAEGAGSFATGGRGSASSLTTVFEVTNLTDVNSPGSLRYACSQSVGTYPNRTIVFRVSGTIHLNSRLNIPANTTIAGQTAPGDGICIADYPVVLNGNNIIMRYIRVRMGDKNQLKTSPANCGVPVAPFSAACMPVDGSGGDDALGDLGHKNIIIDHCSVSWSSDEALTMYRGDSLTIQWTIISEPLNYSYHFETGDSDFENHGYGGIWGARHASFHHNLFAHCRNRTPRFAGNETYSGDIESADFRNNVLYNWGINNIYGGAGGQYNLVNNYYKSGPNTSSGVRYRIVTVDKDDANGFPYAKYYLDGNHVVGSAANTADNWLGAVMSGGSASDIPLSKVTTPFLSAFLPGATHTALEAFDTVLKGAGCIIPVRDTLDARIANDVRNGTGRIIDVQGGFAHGTPYTQTVDAWPNLASGVAIIDTDHDGMPDDWETANGLNPNSAADRGPNAADPNGYTNLEKYLNSITGQATNPPTPPVEGSAASVEWPLQIDEFAQNTGDVSGSVQQLGSGLQGISYNSVFGTVPYWQRTGTTSYLPVGYNENTYVEYKLTPTNGKKFTAQKMEWSALGGGTGTAKLAVYYSLDDFATAIPAGTCHYNSTNSDATVAVPVSLINTSTTPLTGQQLATINTSIEVAPSQTLSVRMYPWITGSGNRYFASQHVKISGVTSTPGSLPVTLLQFSAAQVPNATGLNWQTVNELNMLRYDVEKSADGVAFVTLGSVAAHNQPSAHYSFKDETTHGNKQSYYRLKMLNKNGSYTYSFVIMVPTNAQQKGNLSVFPNPAAEYITILHDAVQKPTILRMYNAEGRCVKTMSLAAGSTQTSISISSFHKGLYMVQLTDNIQAQSKKFLKN